jgi:hypothetical protein
MGGLNIKNEETVRLVRELATLRGLSLVAAVDEAVQEKLDKENAAKNSRNKREGMAKAIMEIARECAPLMNDGRTTHELFEELYDAETGLPK